MKRFVIITAAMCLAACQTPSEPKIVPQAVLTPVAKSCIPHGFRDAPVTPDTDEAVKAAAGPGELLQLLAASRLLYRQWISEARPIIAACR